MYKFLIKPSMFVALVFTIVLTIVFVTSYYDGDFSPIQKVEVNKVDLQNYAFRHSLRLPPLPPLLTGNDSIDKKMEAMYEQSVKDFNNRVEIEDLEYTRPYKLTTLFNGHKIIDYGNAKEIDSLKCIRIVEIKRISFVEDSVENVISNELKMLNQPCQNN